MNADAKADAKAYTVPVAHVNDLVVALVAAQEELPTVLGKDSDGQIQNRTYRYLSLDKLIDATRPILTKHGLAIIQHPCVFDYGEGPRPALKTVERSRR